MSRFHLYAGTGDGGYLLDLQTDFLSQYNSRIVAPVIPEKVYDGAATGLNPVIEVEGTAYVVLTHLLSAVPAQALRTVVGDFSSQADEFTRALDLLFQGY
ncbi:CcdB family protein [Marimonas sp. MJW-29]|uniref:Toxin CcdB n=1 Tax=Sulfitobacter sediminis TaxID=3234186 RepID=A0ABV3RNU6_9RHOB